MKENRVFGGKKSTSSILQGIKFILLFGGKKDVRTYARVSIRESTFWKKKVDLIEKPGYEGKSSFWREQVDFIKTARYKVYLTFWREKRRLHLCSDLNTRVDFLEKKIDPIEKPGYEGKSSFWREKLDFFKTPGDKKYLNFWW